MPDTDSRTTHTCPHCNKPLLSRDAQATLNYMIRECPKRGGYMYEGARPAYERGEYKDADLAELLAVGAIGPHEDSNKGWVVKW